MAPGGYLRPLSSGALPAVDAQACQRLQGVGAHHPHHSCVLRYARGTCILFSGVEIFDASDRRPSDDDSSRRYVGAGGGAGLQREELVSSSIKKKPLCMIGNSRGAY